MKNNLYKIITMVIGIGILGSFDTVFAGDNNIGGDPTAAFSSCGATSVCYSATIANDQGSRVYVNGIRVSVVDSNGSRISGTHSHDYVQNGGHLSNIKDGTFKFYSTKYTKLELLAAAPGAATAKAGSGYTFLDQKWDIPLYMSATSTNTLVKDYFNAYPDEDLKVFFQEACGYDVNANSANLANHYLLIEPLTYMRVTDKTSGNPDTYKVNFYFGTVTEVAQMVRKDGYQLWSETCAGGVTGHFGRMLPFSLYSETSGAGLVGVQTWAEQDGEDGSVLKCASNEILTVNGVAAGHVVMTTYFEPGPCEVNPNELPKCCYLPQNRDILPQCCGLEENKNKPECNPDLCTFTLDMSCPGDCDDDTAGYIKDIEDWSCIFESRISADPNIKDHFYKWGNRYCSVYCRESLYYEFPNSGMTVSAGSHFTIGNTWNYPNWGPIHFVGRSECRTTSDTGDIRWDLFETDWEAANNTVKSNWDTYQIAIKRTDAVAAATNKSASNDCHSTCDSWSTCGTAPNTHSCCTSSSYKNHIKKPATVYYEGSNVTPGEWCDYSSTPTFDVSGKRSTYLSSITSRDTLESNLLQCNDWERTYEEFEPVIGLQYSEAVYGGNYYNLSKSLERRTQTNYFVNGDNSASIDTYKKTDFTYKYVCNTDGVTCVKGSTVTGSKMTYPVNDWLKQFTTKEYDYTLPANIYRYVLKPSGESINNQPGAGQNYVDVGYSNLPVHYSRSTGSYDIFLQYTTFGTGHNFNKFIFEGAQVDINYGDSVAIYTWLFQNGYTYMIEDCHEGGHHLDHSFGNTLINAGRLQEFLNSGCAQQYGCYDLGGSLHKVTCPGDNTSGESLNYKQLMQCIATQWIATPVSRDCDTKYDCKYNVSNSIMDDPGDPGIDPEGMDVVYRTISLTNPFPGKSGGGRTPGDNWNSSSLIRQYITNNRNLQQPERIYYDREPMYEINLNPVAINRIRSYNRTQSANNRGGYADYNLDCISGTGKECKSDFIRDIFDDYFVSNRCGMSSNWNACTISDESRG